ncbi:hypothetical protein SERLA73DRAFT_48157 [Serpula lacrymans var. lacrymans S7.3]|uniref:Uncharacterized protein n=1 Tax=Serpula lacrymans var. lacrymans (strain S7.3) TaxID=936435 RepID=F8PLF8_SERL3|nr:hypothetical protein SERLA73DRAFT_48157 [Serpula lacrymans var. lacrymans S7.3]
MAWVFVHLNGQLGNLGQEFHQPSNLYANLSQRGHTLAVADAIHGSSKSPLIPLSAIEPASVVVPNSTRGNPPAVKNA